MNNADMSFEPVTRHNWEKALTLKTHPHQAKFAPTAAESLAAAYVKPWDEAFDPYVILVGSEMVGLFYVSYTPNSEDNYWIGGLIIDAAHQRKGYGTLVMKRILDFVASEHSNCRQVKLTVEKDNEIAQRLYKKLGFADTAEVNKYGEVIYTIDLDR